MTETSEFAQLQQHDNNNNNNSPSEMSSSSRTTTHHPDARFTCSICLECVQHPVVTLCGHLYCWPCLYVWLEEKSRHTQICPVCKRPCDPQTCVIPIYVKNHETTTTRNHNDSNNETNNKPTTGLRLRFRSSDSVIPDVPRPRPVSTPPRTTTTTTTTRSPAASLSHGLFPLHSSSLHASYDPNREQHTEYLSRLLLLLGSFVLLCLLIFP